MSLWAWTARYAEDGEFPAAWLSAFNEAVGRRHRLTSNVLARFMELGLVECHAYTDDGSQVFVIANWREYRPVDLTSAERKRLYRQRLYGSRYYGTLGNLAEVWFQSAEEPRARRIG